jgi:hypothetical protein
LPLIEIRLFSCIKVKPSFIADAWLVLVVPRGQHQISTPFKSRRRGESKDKNKWYHLLLISHAFVVQLLHRKERINKIQ